MTASDLAASRARSRRDDHVLGLGIIGAGRAAANHAAALGALEGVALRGVSDLEVGRAAALAAGLGASAFDDHQQLLARDDVDAIVIALPQPCTAGSRSRLPRPASTFSSRSQWRSAWRSATA